VEGGEQLCGWEGGGGEDRRVEIRALLLGATNGGGLVERGDGGDVELVEGADGCNAGPQVGEAVSEIRPEGDQTVNA
jgi:hypothetical protein